jgi:hypothetical protein
MTVPAADGATPGKTSSQRIEVVVSYTGTVEVPKRFPTPEEMIAAAGPVLACRGRGHHHGRHPHHACGGWLCSAMQVFGGGASTVRACLLFPVSVAAVIGAERTSGVGTAAPLGILLTVLTALAIWTARPRRLPEPRL